jgi:serpin B
MMHYLLFFIDIVLKHDEARKEVNLWVENKTKGIIKDILSPGMVHSLTRLIFANALYFKGAWKQEFDISKTKDYDFHLLNGSSVEVPFMTSKDDQFISSFDGFKVLRLPYKQGKDTRQFSIYIFLPDAKDGLLALIDKVTSNAEFLEDMLPYHEVEVGKFRIPKFNFSFGVDTTELLKDLGLVLPFEMGGLTKMVDSSISEELFVSDIIQKSFIEINEEGTTAAAVTILAACGCSMYRQIPTLIDFVADHPFLFMIRDDFSGTILFTGQVLNPLAKE